MTPRNVRVLAVVVTFHPERSTLLALLEAMSAQVDEILIVDNTPWMDDSGWNALSTVAEAYPTLRMVRLGKNLGIAAALNVGIEAACREGFSHLLMSDQDSLPAPEMVRGLCLAEGRATDAGSKVAAIGPVYVDRVTRMEYPFQVQVPGRCFYSNRCVTDDEPDVETLSLITSGCLISVPALKEIGGMAEGLFIDHVDVEWCHRAVSKGYVLIGTRRGMLFHNMGDHCLSVWFLGWKSLNGYGPTRLYYRYRNFVHLLRLPYISSRWKVRASWYWLGNLYGHVFFGTQRISNLQAIVVGLWDGIRGVWGVKPSRKMRKNLGSGQRAND